ncbi:transcription factor Iwr1, partial [archaeon]
LAEKQEDGRDQEMATKKRKEESLSQQLQDQKLLGSSAAVAQPAAKENTKLPTTNEKQIVLHRVTTFQSGSRSHLDNVTKQYLGGQQTEQRQEELKVDTEQSSSNPKKRSRLVVSQGRSRLKLDGDQSYVVLDMYQTHPDDLEANQQPSKTSKPSPDHSLLSNLTQPATQQPTKVKVLDPASRQLEKGILLAIEKGDFNGIATALIQGANPDHQIPMEKGGYTALMAAASRVNVRMVNRLLVSDVNVCATNGAQQTALDMVKETTHNKADAQEVRQLLQSALIKHMQRKAMEEKKKRREESILSDQYVVDVYTIHTDTQAHTIDEGSNSAAEQARSEAEHVERVKVEGLRILDDGQVDLLTYDSDWSDLADDEDVDSNDERYEGNDYPEDEDSHDDEEDDEDEEEEDNVNFRQRQAHVKSTVQGIYSGGARGGGKASVYDNIKFEDEDNDVPLFERIQRVGKVMPKHFIGEAAAGRVHDVDSLQALWGMEATPSNPQEERVAYMNQRTGMTFGANPREFMPSGLAKYGGELSDDEKEGDYYEEQGDRDMMNDVAYDSEYDEEADHDT